MDEPVDITFRINNDELEVQSRQAVNSILGVNTAGQQAARSADTLEGKLKGLLAGFAGTAALTGFVKQIVSVRGEIQALEASFSVLLGSEEKAMSMLGELRQFEIESPLDTKAIAEGAQMMLSFGVEADKVVDIIKRLGDVSMGDSGRFRTLALSFSQMNSIGHLISNDVRQMATAGFNPLAEMARTTGKSMEELNKIMASGAISAEMVADAFRTATSEGGQFYGMTQQQSEGIRGLQAQLEGAVRNALNEIGEASEGVISAAYRGATEAVENYREIGEILMIIAGVYGTYKAALVATAVVQKLNIAVLRQAVLEKRSAAVAGIQLSNAEAIAAARTKMLTLAKLNLSRAIKSVTASMATNPYAMVAAAIAVLGYGVYKFISYQTQAEKITKDLNKEFGAEEQMLNVLVQRFKRTKEGTREYSDAKKQLEERYGEALKSINLEVGALHESESAYKRLTEEIRNNTKEKLRNKYAEQYASESGKEVFESYQGMQKSIFKKLGEGAGGEFYTQVKDFVEKSIRYIDGEGNEHIRMLTSEQNKELRNMAESVGLVWEDVIPYANKIASSNRLLQKDLKELDGVLDGYVQTTKKTTGAGEESEKEFINVAQRVADAQKSIRDLNREIDDLRAGKTPVVKGESIEGVIDSKLKEVEKQKAIIKSLTGIDPKDAQKTTGKANKRSAETAEKLAAIEEEQKKLRQQEIDSELALRQAKIDVMKDGNDKELAQIDLNYDKRMLENARKAEALIKQQQKIEQDTWEAAHPNWKEKGQVFSSSKKGVDYLTPEQQRQVADETAAANAAREKAETDLLNVLIDKYQDYTQKREAIEKQFNDDLATLRVAREKAEADGNDAQVSKLNSAIAQATKDKGKELISFDFNLLQENPEYVRAFENLKNTSTETLNELLSQLEAVKTRAAEVLKPDELREYTGAIQSIVDELTARSPFQALAAAQNELSSASKALADARKNLTEAQKEGNPTAIAKAQEVYRKALDDTSKANNRVIETQEEVNRQMETLYESLRGIGDTIGGQAGEIINLIADVRSFVNTTISGIQKAATAGATTLATIEKASAILAIIQMAIQLLNQLQTLLPDAHAQYEKYAEQVAEINKLTDAVNEYEIAVTKAKQAMENWFADDSLKSLKDARELHEKVASAYFDKLREEQAAYQNESGSGWGKYVSGFTAAVTMTSFGDAAGATAVMANTIFSVENYTKNMVQAMENLRIETRKASKGIFGSGIGGHSQQTTDLVARAREQGLGELFDKDGLINEELAKQILEKYNDKLVGETEATLEALVELKEQYNEYLEQLQEYVSDLYAPLVDNIVDSMWDWFDEGKDALDSFHEYASDTFRDIVSDMMRTIVLREVIGTFEDDIADLYKRYSENKLTEQELMAEVADRVSRLTDDYEIKIPVLQEILNTVSEGFNASGFDIRQVEEAAKQDAQKGMFETMSQESATALLGQFTAFRVHVELIYVLLKELDFQNMALSGLIAKIEKNTADTVAELKEVNRRLKRFEDEGVRAL
jgi:tape measure domain-containing protein